MKEKIKENYNILIPLINSLLFDQSTKRELINDKHALSDEFIKAFELVAANDDDQLHYLKEKVITFLAGLNQSEREYIYAILIENEEFMDGMLLVYYIENKELFSKSKLDIQVNLLKELHNFTTTAEINRYVLNYFLLYFKALFEFEFSNPLQVTKQEYFKILELFTQRRTLLTKEN